MVNQISVPRFYLSILLVLCLILSPSVLAYKTYDADELKYTMYDLPASKQYEIWLNDTGDSIINSYAEGDLIVYSDSVVFDDLFYLDRNGRDYSFNTSIGQDFRFFINDTLLSYNAVNRTYNLTDCSYTANLTAYNCTYDLIDWDWEAMYTPYWLEINASDIINASSYRWRIESKKPRSSPIDFIITTGDEGNLTEWAWWNNSWTYKKAITGISGEYPTFNVTYDADMNSNFSDIRFLDSSETIELNHTLRVKDDGVSATFTVDVNGNSTIYMYFGNPSAQSTSDVNATFHSPVFMVTWDDGITDLITNTTGTPVNGPVVQPGIIGSAYNCSSALSQYFNFGDVAKMSAGSDMTLFGIFRVGDINAVDYVIGKDGVAPRGWAFGYASSGVPNTNFYTFETGGAGSPDAYALDTLDFNWYYSTWRFDDASNSIDTWINGTSNNNNSFPASVNDVSYDTYICQRSYPGSPQQYDGIVDDMILYDRALSDDEIADLNSMSFQNATFGSKQASNELTVTLIEPSDNTQSTNGSLFFNCTATDETGVTSLNMTINGVQVNSTIGPGSTNLSLTHTNNSFPEGNYQWYCTASDLSEDKNSSIYSFSVDLNDPSVSILTPLNNSIIYNASEAINLSWDITDTTLDSCWYELSNDSQTLLPFGSATNVSFSSGSKAYYLNNDSTGGSIGDLTFNYNFGGNYHSFSTAVLTNLASWSNAGTGLDCASETYTNATIDFYSNIGNDTCIKLLNGTYALATIQSNTSFSWNYLAEQYPQYPVTCSDNSTLFNYPSSNPSNLTIYMFANDSFGKEGTDNVTIFANTVAPSITIYSPLTNYSSLEPGQSIDLNFSVTTNGTLDTCWYNYAGSNTTLNCSENTTFSYVDFENSITVYANDTLGNLGSQTRSWTVLFDEINQTYDNESYVTYYNNFSADVFTSASSITNPILVYNDTEYPATLNILNSTYFRLTGSLSNFENMSGNNSFHWNITLNGVNFSTATRNQSIEPINFSICEDPNNITFVNLDFIDEETANPLSARIRTSSWVYYIQDPSAAITYTYGVTTNQSLYSFCFTPSDQNITMDAQISYSADGYPERTTGFEFNLSNIETNETLNLLSDGSGLYATFKFIDSITKAGLSTVNVHMYDGTTLIIDTFTDDQGIISEWLNPNVLYTVTGEKTGYNFVSRSIRPVTTNTYIIEMDSGTFTVDPELANGLFSEIYPVIRDLDNNSLYNFGFYASEGDQDISLMNYTVYDDEGNIVAFEQQSGDGNMTQNAINTSSNNTFSLVYVITGVDGGYITGSAIFNINGIQPGSYSLESWGQSFDVYFPSSDRNTLTLLIWYIIWFIVMLGGFTFGYNGSFKTADDINQNIKPNARGSFTMGLVFAFLITLVFSYFNLIPVNLSNVPALSWLQVGWIEQNLIAAIMLAILLWQIIKEEFY